MGGGMLTGVCSSIWRRLRIRWRRWRERMTSRRLNWAMRPAPRRSRPNCPTSLLVRVCFPPPALFSVYLHCLRLLNVCCGTVTHIIRQGRCTLVATIQMYKILALNCLITAYSLSVQYLDGIKYGDYQVTITGMLMSVCFLCISRAKVRSCCLFFPLFLFLFPCARS